MRTGHHAFIYTEYFSDPQLITIGDDAALGGSVPLPGSRVGGAVPARKIDREGREAAKAENQGHD